MTTIEQEAKRIDEEINSFGFITKYQQATERILTDFDREIFHNLLCQAFIKGQKDQLLIEMSRLI